MKYKVVLVPFPFDDLSATKVRPAICLTEPLGPHKHIVVAFITSQAPATPLSSDYLIGEKHPDFGSTGLRVSSTLRLHRLMTISASLLQRELGQLSGEMQTAVTEKLRTLFGI
jgi:mRNA interferase MazF